MDPNKASANPVSTEAKATGETQTQGAGSPIDDKDKGMDSSQAATVGENDKGAFDKIYDGFAKLGDKMSDGASITKDNMDKWLKEAKIIDGEKITSEDTAKYYSEVAKDKAKATKEEFDKILDAMGKEKDMKTDEIKEKLGSVKNPGEPGVGEKVKNAASNFWDNLTGKNSDESSESEDKDKK